MLRKQAGGRAIDVVKMGVTRVAHGVDFINGRLSARQFIVKLIAASAPLHSLRASPSTDRRKSGLDYRRETRDAAADETRNAGPDMIRVKGWRT